jgi:hypothetical protein
MRDVAYGMELYIVGLVVALGLLIATEGSHVAEVAVLFIAIGMVLLEGVHLLGKYVKQ